MRVYKIQLEGHNGPLVLTKPEQVLDELHSLLAEGDEHAITVTPCEMAEEEYQKLPPFAGY